MLEYVEVILYPVIYFNEYNKGLQYIPLYSVFIISIIYTV